MDVVTEPIYIQYTCTDEVSMHLVQKSIQQRFVGTLCQHVNGFPAVL